MDLLSLLWTLLVLAFGLLIGVVCAWRKVLVDPDALALSKLAFFVSVPCLAFKAMASHGLLHLNWAFVGSFLVTRVLGALVCGVGTFLSRGGASHFAVNFMCSTWMEAVVYGVPIISALHGHEAGLTYPVLAALSSFLFELPALLVFFEIGESLSPSSSRTSRPAGAKYQKLPSSGDGTSTHRQTSWLNSAGSIVLQIVRLPPLWAVLLGGIWGLTSIKVPTFLNDLTTNFGACAAPCATVAVGVSLFFLTTTRGLTLPLASQVALCSACKQILLPLLALLAGLAFRLGHVPCSSGVILAALPIALPAFTLCKKYSYGEDLASLCITVQSVLMLPTVLAWVAILSAIGLLPRAISSSSTFD